MTGTRYPGRFIVFEGVEGAGKSTQIERLARHLSSLDPQPLVTREPGGTELGRALREWVLSRSDSHRDPLVEAFLMVTDRADHVSRVVRPALLAGRVVLCDRYEDATFAYQGGGSGVPEETLRALSGAATGGLRPDLLFFLDLPITDLQARLDARDGASRDRFESESIRFFERVRETYLRLAEREPSVWHRLDARRSVEEIAREIRERVDALLAKAPPA